MIIYDVLCHVFICCLFLVQYVRADCHPTLKTTSINTVDIICEDCQNSYDNESMSTPWLVKEKIYVNNCGVENKIPSYILLEDDLKPCEISGECDIIKHENEAYCYHKFYKCSEQEHSWDSIDFLIDGNVIKSVNNITRSSIKNKGLYFVDFWFPLSDYKRDNGVTNEQLAGKNYGYAIKSGNNVLYRGINVFPTAEELAVINLLGRSCNYVNAMSLNTLVDMDILTGTTEIKVVIPMLNLPGCITSQKLTVAQYSTDIAGFSFSSKTDIDIMYNILKSPQVIWHTLALISANDLGDGRMTWQKITQGRDPNLSLYNDKAYGIYKYKLTQDKINQLMGDGNYDALFIRTYIEVGGKVFFVYKNLFSTTAYHKFIKYRLTPPKVTRAPVDIEDKINTITTKSTPKARPDNKNNLIIIASSVAFVIVIIISILILAVRRKIYMASEDYRFI